MEQPTQVKRGDPPQLFLTSLMMEADFLDILPINQGHGPLPSWLPQRLILFALLLSTNPVGDLFLFPEPSTFPKRMFFSRFSSFLRSTSLKYPMI